MTNSTIKICCEKLKEEIINDVLLCVMDLGDGPTLYLQSDGGHGGLEAISFCPFCGTGVVPEPVLPQQPKGVITFHREECFKARRLLDNGQWQRWESPTSEWVNEEPDPIQRKLAELLLAPLSETLPERARG